MLKPIFKILYNKLEISGFNLIVPVKFKNNYIELFDLIEEYSHLPEDINKVIISYLPNYLDLYIRIDIPNSFPINSLYLTYNKLENKYLAPSGYHKNNIEYLLYKIKKYNQKYSMIEYRNRIDFDYLKKKNISYMIEKLNYIYNDFSRFTI